MRLLQGEVVADDSDDAHSDNLHAMIDELREQLRESQRETAAAKRESARALAELRRQLGPLHKALKMVFGELDAAGVDDAPMASTHAWDEWKRRLGPACAKVIDALLLGGEMSVKGITVSAKMGQQTVYQATSKMGQAGILVRNGSKFSLKKL